jgi:hypothetical protein
MRWAIVSLFLFLKVGQLGPKSYILIFLLLINFNPLNIQVYHIILCQIIFLN